MFAAASLTEAFTEIAERFEAANPQTEVRLQIAVPRGHPAPVRGLPGFSRQQLDLAICAPEMPCGEAAAQAFRVAGVRAKPDTLEQDVKAVLTKVARGEVDAGLVYRTDVAAADPGKVTGVSFPAARRAIQRYAIARMQDAPNPSGARAFIAYVRSPAGQRVLDGYGFTTGSSS